MPSPGRPEALAGYLEAISRLVFAAGLSRRVIDAKWTGIRDAFAGFDPLVVADFGPADIERLLADPGLVRSRAKIEAIIDNAQALLELDAEHGGFDRYLQSHGGLDAAVADLKRQFRFIGDTGAHDFLAALGRSDGPPHEAEHQPHGLGALDVALAQRAPRREVHGERDRGAQ